MLTCPFIYSRASRGGFGTGVTPGGNPIWRNPCAELVLPILPHVLALFRALNQLYDPQAMQLLHEVIISYNNYQPGGGFSDVSI